MDKIKAIDFFNTWCKVTRVHKDEFLKAKDKWYLWYNSSAKTELIEGIVYPDIAKELGEGYECYINYYHTDAIFYLPQDLLPNFQPYVHFFRNIRIALEHENDFTSGLHSELTHLMILKCDLRVLVTYFHNYDSASEMNRLHDIVSDADNSYQYSEEESILLIIGTRTDTETVNIFWEGYIYKKNEWRSIDKVFLGHLPKT